MQFVRIVEVIFDRGLAATGDEDEVLDAGGARLLDGVLDQRFVHDRQHFLGHGLGGREKAGAQPPDGEDRLTYALHEGFPNPVAERSRMPIAAGDASLTDIFMRAFLPAGVTTLRTTGWDSRSIAENTTRYRSGLMVKKKIAGAIDLRRQICGTAPIGVQLLHKVAMGLANL